MADNSNNPMDWLNGWNEIQRQAWNTWSTMAMKNMDGGQKTNPFTTPFSNPFANQMGMGSGMGSGMGGWTPPSWSSPDWRNGLDWWQRFLTSARSGSPEQTIFKEFAHWGTAYPEMAKQIFKTMQELQTGSEHQQAEWTETLRKNLEEAKQALAGHIEGLYAPWNSAFNDQATAVFTNFGQSSPWSGNQSQLGANMKRLLTIMAPDVLTKWQARMETGQRYTETYQKTLQNFLKVQVEESSLSLDILGKKLSAISKSGTPLKSLQEIFDLWVQCAEEAHAKISFEESYKTANAHLVNAMNQLRIHYATGLDEILVSLNLPNRGELDRNHESIQSLKRRMRAMEDDITSLKRLSTPKAEIESLRDELEKMGLPKIRKEIEDLNNRLTNLAEQKARENDLNTLQADIPSLRNELTELKRQIATMQEVQKRLDTLKEEITRLEIPALRQSVSTLAEKIQHPNPEVTVQIQALRQSVSTLTEKIQHPNPEVTVQIQALRKEIEEIKSNDAPESSETPGRLMDDPNALKKFRKPNQLRSNKA
ncbi:MAG: hypothetical protein H7832_02900 [Magnetococcus sp. DMHC-6]